MKTIFTALALTCIVALTGCNTVAGAGQDISSGGHAVSHGAENVKNNM